MFINNNTIEAGKQERNKTSYEPVKDFYESARDIMTQHDDPYYFIENFNSQRCLKSEADPVPTSLKTVKKKKKEPKINLEFLKCYWRRDYQQLAKSLKNDEQSIKELPFLVTSYTKDQGKTIKSPLSKIDKNKHTSPQEVQSDQSSSNLRNRDPLTFKRIEKKIDTPQSRKTEENIKLPTKTSCGHVFKGINSKLNLKSNAYKNLDYLMESNQAFYFKYQGQPISGQNKPSNTKQTISLENPQIDRASNQHSIATRQTFDDNDIPTLPKNSQSQRVQKTLTPLSQARPKIVENPSRFGNLVLSRRSFTNRELLNDDQQQEETEYLQSWWDFPCCTIKQVHIIPRAINKPCMVLVIQVEGILTVDREAYFGFQEENLNQQLLQETKSYFLKQFNLLPEKESETNITHVQKSIKDIFKALSRAFFIVLIFKRGSHQIEPVSKYLLERKIFFDGIYTVSSENSFVTDYGQILKDFNISHPKRLIIVKGIELDDGDDVLVEKIQKIAHSPQRQKLDSFPKNVLALKLAKITGSHHKLSYGLFPKAQNCDAQNIRLVIVPKLTYKLIQESIKNHKDIPSLDRLEQAMISLMNEFSFINLINKHKHNLLRLGFKNHIQAIQEERIISCQRKQSIQQLFTDLMKKSRNELDNDSDTFISEEADNWISEVRKKSCSDIQQRVLKHYKQLKPKKNLTEEQINDLNLKVFAMVEELYNRNKLIMRQFIRLRTQLRQRVNEFWGKPIPKFHQVVNCQEYEYCQQFDGITLYDNLLP